jgi:hypothetical protein
LSGALARLAGEILPHALPSDADAAVFSRRLVQLTSDIAAACAGSAGLAARREGHGAAQAQR